ncbi:hypothetical protein LINGRAHAP2_LOCUS22021 [Linum grandiflorum]
MIFMLMVCLSMHATNARRQLRFVFNNKKEGSPSATRASSTAEWEKPSFDENVNSGSCKEQQRQLIKFEIDYDPPTHTPPIHN